MISTEGGIADGEEMIAFCGLNCAECGAFLATQDDDDERRKKVAEQWSEKYRANLERVREAL